MDELREAVASQPATASEEAARLVALLRREIVVKATEDLLLATNPAEEMNALLMAMAGLEKDSEGYALLKARHTKLMDLLVHGLTGPHGSK